MTKKILCSCFVLMLCFFSVKPEGISLKRAKATEETAEVHLSDSAGLLSAKETDTMEQNLGKLVERYGVSVFLITSDNLGKQDDYLSYLKKQKKAAHHKDILLILVGIKNGEELCSIQAYGAAKQNLTKERLKRLEASVEQKLQKRDYDGALELLRGRFLTQMSTDPYFDAVWFHPLLHLLVCLLVTTGGFYFLLRHPKEQRLQQQNVPYLDEKCSVLLGSLDHFSYITEETEQTKKAKWMQTVKHFFVRTSKNAEEEEELF